jgi:molecular chaperone GrpE (heat shock protein)
VQELIFTNGRIEAGKTRVLEARKVSGEIPTGTIINVCRKGYQRGDKIIRPADVITAE